MSTFKFPFFDVRRQYQQLEQEVLPVLAGVFERQAFVLGDAVDKFEEEIAQWIGVKHAITVSSGTDALILALKALDIQPGDEVITPAFSFFASTGSILWTNAKPVFVDIDPQTYNMDPNELEKRITSKTKAIMPVHLYGQMADMDPIVEISKKYNIPILEDFAQSIGAHYKEQPSGGIGDLGATSFYPTKNLGGAGEGGLITTNDDKLAEKVKLIRVHGMKVRYQHDLLGTNSRLDAIQCQYLHIKLRHLKKYMSRREYLAQRYSSAFKGYSSITLPYESPERTHVWNQYVIRVENRDEVRTQMAERGIPTEIYYPMTIPEQPVLRDISPAKGWPVSEKASQEVLALPIFPELTDSEQDQVIENLLDVVSHYQEKAPIAAKENTRTM